MPGLQRPSDVFVEQMRIQRARKGWTQKQLAARMAKLGFVVHQTTIGKWETAERRITLDEALALAVALDVDPTHMVAGSYSDVAFGRPSIALSPKTPPLSARQMRMWVRGQQPVWGQDEKRYYTEVSPDEWRAVQRPGVAALVRALQDLLDAFADDDLEVALELVEIMREELERQHRALARELSKKARPSLAEAPAPP